MPCPPDHCDDLRGKGFRTDQWAGRDRLWQGAWPHGSALEEELRRNSWRLRLPTKQPPLLQQLLLSTLIWHPVDAEVAEDAGALGRRWLPSHRTIDGADLAIAATAVRIGARLLTRNVRHFPMFPELQAPY